MRWYINQEMLSEEDGVELGLRKCDGDRLARRNGKLFLKERPAWEDNMHRYIKGDINGSEW